MESWIQFLERRTKFFYRSLLHSLRLSCPQKAMRIFAPSENSHAPPIAHIPVAYNLKNWLHRFKSGPSWRKEPLAELVIKKRKNYCHLRCNSAHKWQKHQQGTWCLKRDLGHIASRSGLFKNFKTLLNITLHMKYKIKLHETFILNIPLLPHTLSGQPTSEALEAGQI